jgi:hypothetical protein
MLSALLVFTALCAPVLADAPAADPRFEEAIRHYQAKTYPLALDEFRAAAAESGAGSLAKIGVCLTELHLGRSASAAKDFQAYASAARRAADPRAGPSMIELEVVSAPFILFGGEPSRLDLLKNLSDALVKSYPADALAWELRGYSGLQAGDKASIDAAAERLRTVAPESALGSFFSGFSATLAGDRAAARTAFTEAVKRDPQFAAARAALAQTFSEDGGDPLARAQFRAFVLLAAAVSIFAFFRLRAALMPRH